MKPSAIDLWKRLRMFRFSSMFFRLFALTMILVIVPIVVISLVVAQFSYNLVKKEITAQAQQSLQDAAAVVDSIMERANYQAAALAENNEVTQLTFPTEATKTNAHDLIWAISRDIRGTSYPDAMIESIYVYSRPQDLIINDMGGTSADYFYDTTWMKALSGAGHGTILLARHLPAPFSVPVLSFIRTIGKSAATNAGAVVINIDIRQLSQLLGPYDSDTYLYITDRDGILLFGPDEAEIGHSYRSVPVFHDTLPVAGSGSTTDTVDGSGYLVSRTETSVGPEQFMYTAYHPMSRFQGSIRKVTSLITIIFALGTVLAIIVSIAISLRGYRPIQGLMNQLDRLFPSKAVAPENSADEVGYLASAITRMAQSNESLEGALKRNLMATDRAREAALRSEIRPHFLYNTLDMIIWEAVALTGGDNKVARMLRDLGGLFRLSFDGEAKLVPLEIELENARQYVRLLKARYVGKFRTVWDVDESASTALVPVLVLQPLIENAFYHGIEPSGRRGTITVSARVVRRELRVSVRDDGVGIAAKKVAEIERQISSPESVDGGHIGVLNVHQRLRLVYGEPFGLSIERMEKKGTCVSLRLPAGKPPPGRKERPQDATLWS